MQLRVRLAAVALSVLMISCALPFVAHADKATDAAACMAIVGGPVGATAAALAQKDSNLLDKMTKNASKAASVAANFASNNCSVHAENIVFEAIAAALTALVATKQLPNDFDAAMDQVNALIGEVLGKILKAALDDPYSPLFSLANQLPQNIKDMIVQGATKELVAQINGSPALQPFISMFTCGVVVATSGVADQVTEAVDNTKGCGKFLATCASSASDCLSGVVELGEAIAQGVSNLPGEALAKVRAALSSAKDATKAIASGPAAVGEFVECGLHPCLTPGVQQEACAVTVECPPGSKLDQCVSLALAKGNLPATCDVAATCAQNKPAIFVGSIGSSKYCACPAGQALHFGSYYATCTTCQGPQSIIQNGFCQTCGASQKANSQHSQCVNACSPGTFASGSGPCAPCAEGKTSAAGATSCYRICATNAAYNRFTKKCDACPANTKLFTDGNGHETCGCNESWKTAQSGECAPRCPSSQIWVPEKVSYKVINNTSTKFTTPAGCAPCWAGMVAGNDNTCVKKVRLAPPGAVGVPAPTRAVPPKLTSPQKFPTLACPPGQSRVNGKCVARATTVRPTTPSTKTQSQPAQRQQIKPQPGCIIVNGQKTCR